MTPNSFASIVAALLLGAPAISYPSGEEDTTPSNVPAGYFGTYEPTINVTWGALTSEEIAAAAANLWNRVFLDELGVDVNFEASADLLNGDLPDIVALRGSQQSLLHELMSAGRIAPITDAWENYASPLLQETTRFPHTLQQSDDRPSTLSLFRNDNNDLMAIPGPAAGLDSYSYLWIRQDWLDSLGLSPPRTFAELLDVARAFTHEDPDQNGEDDTYAMVLDYSPSQDLEGFFWSFGAYPDTWQERTINNTSYLTYGAVSPETERALLALHGMYREGLLYDQRPHDGQQPSAGDPLSRNLVGIYYGPHWAPYDFLSGWVHDQTVNWSVYPPPTVDGRIAKGEIELDLQRIYAVRSGYEYPESLVKMLNKYWEKFYDHSVSYGNWYNDEYWLDVYDNANVDVDRSVDYRWSIPQVTMVPPSSNVAAFEDIQSVYEGATQPSDLTGLSRQYYNNIEGNPDRGDRWAWQEMFSDPQTSAFANITQRIHAGDLFVDTFSTRISPLADNWSELQRLQDQSFVEVITSDGDPRERFLEFVQAWNDGGGEQITLNANEQRISEGW